ncbi:MAG TPA: hypothetical protein VLK24_04850 [Gaiellaceae bacterium]|nr:hypothetical protein [Gaiellaceae bacterium]
MNATAGALLRFWWLVVAGIAAGVLAAVFVYSLESQAKHTATTRVFVSSPSAPYLRTQAPQSLAPRVRTVRNATGGTRTVQQPPSASTDAPDTQTLVNAANLYPLLIESDRIAAIRESQAGTIPGTVKANALNSSTNTFGVFRPSSLPIVEVKATSRTAGNASKLATATVKAFDTWIRDQQRRSGIPSAQRIIVTQLQSPELTTTGGPSWGLPLFVGALVLLGFCGLAVIADNARPARDAEERSTEPARATAVSPHLDA